MATLKSIKNKYLTTSDGDVLGVTTNTENVSLLSLKLATADSLSKFNLVDGFTDDYNDATGVDASASTNEARDSSGKYYKGMSSQAISSTGGTITTYGDYTIHKFTADGTYNVAGTVLHDFLIVAGGGGGGSRRGGGGGAGGLVYKTGEAVTASTNYTIDIGPGGDGGVYPGGTSYDAGSPGTDTTAFSYTALGGGGGGVATAGPYTGGSGGGNGRSDGVGNTAGAAATQPGSASGGFGTPGGGHSGNNGGRGGGGADINLVTSCHGGDGKAYTILDGSTSVYYAGGGGGGDYGTGPGCNGGQGGGGAGSPSGAGGGSGSANTGGGGGGAATGWSGFNGGNGGSGIVIIKRPTNEDTEGGNMTLASNVFTAQADPTTIRIIMDEYTSTGSATVNTDIKAYASRDNGTTYTQITSLASQGTIETTHRLLSGSVDISGQPSGTSVKYKIETLNQSASKTTRVYGTSMAWA